MTIRRKSKFLILSFFIMALFAMVLSGKCSGMKRIADGNSEQIFSNGTEDIDQPQEKKICKRGEDPSIQKDLAKLLLLSGYEAEISDVSQRAKALPTYQDRSSIKAEKTVGQLSAKEVCSESDKENPQSKVEHKKDLKDERFILMSGEDVEAVPDVREKADVVLTPKEAFEKSIVEKGKFALDYVLKLLENKYDANSIYEALKGEIFIDPESLETRRYIVRDEYLSGNVKKKLRVAEDAAAKDEIFNINVQELRKVLPKDLTENEITVNLGATWFPPDIIRDFIIECFGIGPLYRNHISVSFSEEEAKWKIICLGLPETRELYEDFGTTDKNAIKLLEDLLNQNDAIVYTSDPSDKKKGKIPDNEKTIWNQYKQKRIKEKFQSWVWEDTTRKDVILKAYNEKFNTVVLRKYVSDKLRFTGKNPEIALRPHQINAVAQIVYGGNTLLAHSVGAGKTYEMIAAAMELKSLGLSKKNLIIVPNHIIGQWKSDFRKLYPGAKILVAKKNDFTDKKIIDFLTKIRDEEYDAIIITLENFFKIPTDLPIPSNFEKRSRKKPQCKLETEESDEMFKDSVDSTLLHEKKTGSAVRATKLDLLQLAREKQLLFENLGIDRLFVDEAHYFKNLHFYSKLLGGRKETPKKVLDFF